MDEDDLNIPGLPDSIRSSSPLPPPILPLLPSFDDPSLLPPPPPSMTSKFPDVHTDKSLLISSEIKSGRTGSNWSQQQLQQNMKLTHYRQYQYPHQGVTSGRAATSQHPPEVQKAIKSIQYVAEHMKKEDEENNVSHHHQ